MNLRARLKLAGQSLLATLDSEHDFMPTGGYEVAHDLGRWWDAILRLEATIDFIIPPKLESASLHNLKRLTDNPDCLLLNRTDIPWLKKHAKINPHNFRESLLAFGALVKFRQNVWAREAGLELIRAMERSLQADGSFDFSRLGSWGTLAHTKDKSHTEEKRNGWFDGTATSGRSLESIIWFYETVKEPLILDIAKIIAEHHLKNSTCYDGSIHPEIINPVNVGHNHSYLGTIRGLLLYGLLMKQTKYIDVVEATYRKAIHKGIVKESGWTPHDLGKIRFPNDYGDPFADPASTGDAAQIALWLALYADCPDLLDDVECYVRARLIPAQLTEDDLYNNPDKPFALRDIGSWGTHGPSHGGKRCLPDVLAAITHTLCDIYQNICTSTSKGLRINFHFDYEDTRIKIKSTRNEYAKLTIKVKQAENLLIRIPKWASGKTLKLTINGQPQAIVYQNNFAYLSNEQLFHDCTVCLTHDLPKQKTKELMPSRRCYHFTWRGDEISNITPQDTPFSFYPEKQK